MAFAEEFLMGHGDWLERRVIARGHPVQVSTEQYYRLVERAVDVSHLYFSQHIRGEATGASEGFRDDVARSLSDAKQLGLFSEGGVREDDFINLRCLAEILGSTGYIESGVFIGSSLFAAHTNKRIERIVAIDPDMRRLKFRDEFPGRTRYVEDEDFGGLMLDGDLSCWLAYFDDHICSTRRLREASGMGLKHLSFDDSVGFHGITQRLYPATPTIGMIRHMDCLKAGETLTWTFVRKQRKRVLKRLLWPRKETLELRLLITDDLLEEMSRARKLVEAIVPFPPLAEVLPLASNERLVDRTKYYVRMKSLVSREK